MVLAMLKIAMAEFLDQLGARDDLLTYDHRAMARVSGVQLHNDLVQSRDSAIVRDLNPEGAALASITEDLGPYQPAHEKQTAATAVATAAKRARKGKGHSNA